MAGQRAQLIRGGWSARTVEILLGIVSVLEPCRSLTKEPDQKHSALKLLYSLAFYFLSFFLCLSLSPLFHFDFILLSLSLLL